jgi:5-(carboxyamino)imidazole ribonucleotide synthase
MKKVGILGGGQLGRMLLQQAVNYPVETFVLEQEPDCPAAHLCHHFKTGNILDYNTVLEFGRPLDAITIEIEAVNIDALEQLEKEGVQVYPKPAALRILQSKILQKEFYQKHQIPTTDFVTTRNKQDLDQYRKFLPAVHKISSGGYDGKGVTLLKTEADLSKGFDAPAVLEKMADIHQEIALLAAVFPNGETVLYPPVEMVFDPDLNLLDYQLCPARLGEPFLYKAEAIALSLVKNLESPGIFAVEMFVTRQGEILVNETAPRVHNSGHHTIEASYSSQFDMLWRMLLDLPPGNTKSILPSVMINIIGSGVVSGPAVYLGLDQILKIDNAYIHLYGKKISKPGRKMGHITMISSDTEELIFKAHRIRQMLKVVGSSI